MATASEVRLSCGCADERHLGTPCSCDTCAEGLMPEHNPTLCPLTPEERPEAIRKQTYEARKQAVEERMRTAIKMAYNLLYTELGHEATVAGVGVLAIKFYDELKVAEAAAKAEADAIQVPAPAKTAAVSQFKTWKTIKLGTGLKTADDFRQALKKAGHRIGDYANDILGQRAFRVANRETEVDLVVVSVSELGSPNGATREDIYRRAQELGLELCPAEVGPQLRLQYPVQPNGERLIIGMEPITGSGGNPRVFRVARGGDGSWLSGRYGGPGGFWLGSSRWVFLRRPSTRA